MRGETRALPRRLPAGHLGLAKANPGTLATVALLLVPSILALLGQVYAKLNGPLTVLVGSTPAWNTHTYESMNWHKLA